VKQRSNKHRHKRSKLDSKYRQQECRREEYAVARIMSQLALAVSEKSSFVKKKD